MRKLGNKCFEEFDPLGRDLPDRSGMPRDIATRPRQPHREPIANGIAAEGHDDRDGPRRSLDGPNGRGWRGDDHVGFETNEVPREIRHPFSATARMPRLYDKVLPLDIAEIAKPFPERL